MSFAKPHPSVSQHCTEKPVELLEYLIRTYTNENDTILDNCMGSGSTGYACVNTNRNFIGIELDENQAQLCRERLANYGVPPENIVSGDCLDNNTWQKLPCYEKGEN